VTDTCYTQVILTTGCFENISLKNFTLSYIWGIETFKKNLLCRVIYALKSMSLKKKKRFMLEKKYINCKSYINVIGSKRI